ncbi:hypothetical protein AAFF39_03775 [Lactococcus garvieae]
MSKFEVVEADIDENTITLDAGDYFKKGGSIELGEEFILQRAKQHKLSIPKNIAEELDGFNPNEGETKIELLIVGYYKSFLSDELMSFCLDDNGLNLCAFYLAGKALGVELVEVE